MENKKTLLLSIVAVLTLVAVVIGATYAYFTAQKGTGTNANLNVQAGTTDSLSFAAGKALSIYATSENFGSGKGNVSDSTTATASLIANNGTNQASYNYYVYLNIEANDLVYTTEGRTPELLLTVTDPNGNVVTSINGLNYVTQNGVSGFDVTTKIGLIRIAENYTIETTSNVSQEWQVALTLINLDSDQEQNTSKTFNAKVMIQQDEIYVNPLTEACAGQNMASCIKTNYQLDSSILLHNASLTNGANDGSYRYTGSDYKLTEKGKRFINIQDGLINLYCDGTLSTFSTFCRRSASYYYTLTYETNGTQYTKLSDAYLQAVADGYLEDNQVKNYVCFGSDTSPCPADNLYRIIGVFGDQVKLIKADYATTEVIGSDGDVRGYESAKAPYKGNLDISQVTGANWNYRNDTSKGSGDNTWATSLLNRTNLNTNYINNIGSTWSNKIATTTWKVGGNSNLAGTPANVYNNEIVSPAQSTTYSAKIGLMYVSDYGFAVTQDNWITELSSYSNDVNRNNNWMYLGLAEWTISRYSETTEIVYNLDSTGKVVRTSANFGFGIRPTFYLNSDIKLMSGNGTAETPFKIN